MRGGRGGGRSFGGGSPYGGRGGGPPSRGPPYSREPPREYERRGPSGPPPPRNGYGYEDYDRGANGYESYYGGSRPQQSMMPGRERYIPNPKTNAFYVNNNFFLISRQMWGQRETERAPSDMMRAPVAAYERRPPPTSGYGEMSRSYGERPQAAPPSSMNAYERRPMYEARPAADMYNRRSPPPPAASYGSMGGGWVWIPFTLIIPALLPLFKLILQSVLSSTLSADDIFKYMIIRICSWISTLFCCRYDRAPADPYMTRRYVLPDDNIFYYFCRIEHVYEVLSIASFCKLRALINLTTKCPRDALLHVASEHLNSLTITNNVRYSRGYSQLSATWGTHFLFFWRKIC